MDQTTENKELITISEIQELLNISRTTFYRRYKKLSVQVPSLTKEFYFTKESVLEAHESIKKQK